MLDHLRDAAEARAAGVRALTDRPSQRRHAQDHDGPSSARTIARFDVRAATADAPPVVVGVASVTERGYSMWDAFGEYTEVVSADAFDATLAAAPLVEFTINHGAGGGLPMSSTRAGTLALSVAKDGDLPGLHYAATVNPARSDVSDALIALADGDLAEASFKFRIVAGTWSPDYLEYRINAVDLDRGDVSAVNFGASPYPTSGLQQNASTLPTAARIATEDTARRCLILDADVRRRSIA